MSLIYKYYTNCSGQMSPGGTPQDGAESEEDSGPRYKISQHEFAIHLVIAVIRFISIFLNILAFLVFLRMRNLVLRGKLIALSGSEVVLCSSSFFRKVWFLSEINGTSHELMRLLDVMIWINFSAIIARNWIVVLIGVSKCDAIVRPIGHTRWHEKYEKVCTGIIWLVAVSFVLFYSSLSQQHYCLDSQRVVNISFPLGGLILDVTMNLFSILQAALPVTFVIITCVLIFVTLRRHGIEHRRTFYRESSAQARTALTSRASRQMDRATNMTIALAVTFVVLELPALVSTTLISLTQNIIPVLGHTSDVCVALDSLANFFLYCGWNQRFRVTLKQLFCCCFGGRKWNGGAAAASGTNQSMAAATTAYHYQRACTPNATRYALNTTAC